VPISEVVVDTNVFMHSNNPECKEYKMSVAFVSALFSKSGKVFLCVDKPRPNAPDSAYHGSIGAEYFGKLNASMWFFPAFCEFIQNSTREKVVDLPVAEAKWIVDNIAKKTDRPFLRVAIVTADHVLVSHDFQDFNDHGRKGVRRQAAKRFGVEIVDAADGSGRM
jgi:hypothetical protein